MCHSHTLAVSVCSFPAPGNVIKKEVPVFVVSWSMLALRAVVRVQSACKHTHLHHVLICQLVCEANTLWGVLGADAPHQRILELLGQLMVDLPTHSLHGGAASV